MRGPPRNHGFRQRLRRDGGQRGEPPADGWCSPRRPTARQIIPATLRYYRDHCEDANRAGMADFLMTATAIGGLFKLNASISGAEVGCKQKP